MARKAEPRRQFSLWDHLEEPLGGPTGGAAPGAGQPGSPGTSKTLRTAPAVWRYPGDPLGTGASMVSRCQNTFPELGGLPCLMRTVDVYCETCAKLKRGLQGSGPG